MQNDIVTFIRALLEKKAPLPPRFDDASDFIAAGIIDSMAIIKFILEIEARFDIYLNDEDIASPDFRTVDGLTVLITNKISS